jgi:hypothetical protein
MRERTTIGDYHVRVLERAGGVVRYAATHVVLPRQAIIELVELDAPRVVAMKLLRRACILEALHHPAVPRVFECGRFEGRPWIAIAHDHGTTLHDELQHRRLEVRELLTLVEQVAAFLSYAHARGVLHGDITPMAIVREPTLRFQRWDNACAHDTELSSDAIDGSDDVFGLGKTALAALATRDAAPDALTTLLARMLDDDPAMRPTAPEVVTAARALRDALGPFDAFDVALALESLANGAEEDGPEIVIEYPTVDRDDDEPILLERRRVSIETATVIVDLDACR